MVFPTLFPSPSGEARRRSQRRQQTRPLRGPPPPLPRERQHQNPKPKPHPPRVRYRSKRKPNPPTRRSLTLGVTPCVWSGTRRTRRSAERQNSGTALTAFRLKAGGWSRRRLQAWMNCEHCAAKEAAGMRPEIAYAYGRLLKRCWKASSQRGKQASCSCSWTRWRRGRTGSCTRLRVQELLYGRFGRLTGTATLGVVTGRVSDPELVRRKVVSPANK